MIKTKNCLFFFIKNKLFRHQKKKNQLVRKQSRRLVVTKKNQRIHWAVVNHINHRLVLAAIIGLFI